MLCCMTKRVIESFSSKTSLFMARQPRNELMECKQCMRTHSLNQSIEVSFPISLSSAEALKIISLGIPKCGSVKMPLIIYTMTETDFSIQERDL